MPTQQQARISREAQASLPNLQARQDQLDRAIRSQTDDGYHLTLYLKAMKSELTEERSRQDPEDIRRNTELHAEVAMLRRIIADWEDAESRLRIVTAEIKKVKKLLDNQ